MSLLLGCPALMGRAKDIGPHTETMAHFTQSLDYVVVTHGTLRLAFHDGSHKDVKVGDVIIQVANIHQWVNVSDEPARESAVVYVLVII
jgi:quercetin dioxygenase-like cupin family protein